MNELERSGEDKQGKGCKARRERRGGTCEEVNRAGRDGIGSELNYGMETRVKLGGCPPLWSSPGCGIGKLESGMGEFFRTRAVRRSHSKPFFCLSSTPHLLHLPAFPPSTPRQPIKSDYRGGTNEGCSSWLFLRLTKLPPANHPLFLSNHMEEGTRLYVSSTQAIGNLIQFILFRLRDG